MMFFWLCRGKNIGYLGEIVGLGGLTNGLFCVIVVYRFLKLGKDHKG